MYTMSSLEGLVRQAREHYENLFRIAGDEKKELGEIKEDTIKRYNAMYLAICEACKALEKGLDGEI